MQVHQAEGPRRTGAEMARFIKALAAGGGNPTEALAAARADRAAPNVLAVLEKAATGVAVSGDSEWAGALAEYSAMEKGLILEATPGSFFYTLAARAVASTLMTGTAANAISMRPAGRVDEAVFVPVVDGLAEQVELDSVTTGGIVVTSEEVYRSNENTAFRQLQTALVDLVAEAADATALDVLTEGLTPIAGTANPLTDIKAAITAIGAGVPVVFGLGRQAALRLATHTTGGGLTFPTFGITGGTILGQTAIVTDGLGTNEMVAARPDQLVINTGTVAVDLARSATLRMADTAEDAPRVVSLFQQNLRAVRVLQSFALAKATQTAVAKVSGVAW